ncbi:hypothetical protein GX888_03085 [Candidatus Dojkabacteria bacterium]|uniref:histidine kinase n=1 Tax=Candidatus Dojkabacteria bacterium TaxID=2099670 RepID=A0A847VDX3_9BACT|nr:hypothetical protein [Candidatus Dojkabacteria bacterium]
MFNGIIGYINILIGFVDLLLGFLVLSSNPKRTVNRAYFLCTLTMGLWSISLSFYNSYLFFDSTQWLKIVYIISYLMTFAQLNFALKFHDGVGKKVNIMMAGVLGPLFAYGLYLLLIKNTVVLDTLFDESINTVIAQMGEGYILYFLPIIFSLFFLFGIHIVKGSKMESLKKRQTQFYWIAGFLMIVPLIFLDFVLPVFFSVTEYYQYSTLGNILWAIIIAYSIYNTRFLDVRLVFGKVVETILKSSYLLVIFVVYTEWNRSNLDLVGSSFILILITISVVLSLLLNWMNQKTELFVQRRFIYSKYNPMEQIQRYTVGNSRELNIRNILKKTIDLVVDTINPDKVAILLFNSKSKAIAYQENMNFPSLTFDTTMRFVSNWENLNSNPVLIFSEIDVHFFSGKEIIDYRKEEILHFMKEYGVEVIIPFELRASIGGLIILGSKIDNSLYSQTDITFLESIMRNANITIERAILYEELQSFNKTLQQRVNEQTKELQIKVEELQEARRKERDMVDIMGHELRTPATIVKLNIDMLERYIDSNPDELKIYIKRIKEAINNEIKLINTLLSSAKLEGTEIEINRERVDIKGEIEMAIHGHERDAKKKGLKIEKIVNSNTPDVYADKARTVEILNNLIDNAIKYTEKGTVSIKSSYNNEYVTVSVKDTGKGIPKEEIPYLGQKFHRVGNYLKSSDHLDIVRPGGTGLGLYVTFRLVKLMGGEISVKSEVDVGSEFVFSLPIFRKGSEIKKGVSSKDMFKRLGLMS